MHEKNLRFFYILGLRGVKMKDEGLEKEGGGVVVVRGIKEDGDKKKCIEKTQYGPT